jgi:hypothetical protein
MTDRNQPLPYPAAPSRDAQPPAGTTPPDGYIRRDPPWVDDDPLAELVERFRTAWDHLPERG